MQLKHWENLANLERSIIKEQFQKVAKQPPDTAAAVRAVRRVGEQRAERKFGKDNQPLVASITAVTGDVKSKILTAKNFEYSWCFRSWNFY